MASAGDFVLIGIALLAVIFLTGDKVVGVAAGTPAAPITPILQFFSDISKQTVPTLGQAPLGLIAAGFAVAVFVIRG